MLELTRYIDVLSFKQDIIPFLEQYEGENNLPLGVLMNLKQDEQPIYMARVTKNGKLSLVLLQTHPRQMIFSKSLPFTSEEVKELAEKLYADYPNIPGLIGESRLVKPLANEIARLKNSETHIHMEQRVYVLREVKKKASDRGTLRLAESRDLPIVERWAYRFCEDVGEPVTVEEAAQKAKDMIEKERLYLWEIDGKLVSMACWLRPTKTNVTVGFVYTPPEERKKGYASDCVSALTQHLLDSGYQTTSLYTDLANPTSNKIYMEIGYEPVMDSTVVFIK
jgi:predicted GNAT family acetyltransferase